MIYALNANSFMHTCTCISFAKSWFSHTYLLAGEQCLLSDIHILKIRLKCKIPSAAPTINNISLRFSHFYQFENFITYSHNTLLVPMSIFHLLRTTVLDRWFRNVILDLFGSVMYPWWYSSSEQPLFSVYIYFQTRPLVMCIML